MKQEIQTIPCSTLISNIENGTLRIPLFAEYKPILGDKEKSCYFIDSVLKNLFWKPFLLSKTKDRIRSVRTIGGISLSGPPKGGFIHYVIDGQWHILSLFASIKGLAIQSGKHKIDFSEMYVDLMAKGDEELVTTDIANKNQKNIIKLKDLLSEGLESLAKYPKYLHDKIYSYRQKIQSYPFYAMIVDKISMDIFASISEHGVPIPDDEIENIRTKLKASINNNPKVLRKKPVTKTKKKESERTTRKRDKFETPKHCPVCGHELVNASSGLWCVNPDCEVTDDCCLYKQNDDE